MFKRKPKITEQSGFEESPTAQQFTRRKFLTRIGLTAFLLTMGGVFTSVVAFILPKLNFEPKTSFSIGPPSDYQVGDMKLLDTYQVYIFRSQEGFQAVSAICTHLGCSYKPFGPPSPDYPVVHAQCPCHGSVFARNGQRIGGPAPKPLPFYEISLSADGRLIVDKGKTTATDELSRLAGVGVGHDLYFDPEQGQMVKGVLPEGKDCKPCQG